MTLSSTVRCGKRLKCWNTMPIRCRSRLGSSFSTDAPSSRMSPRSGSCNRFRVRSRVDLPEPDGPITATVLPAGASIWTPPGTNFGQTKGEYPCPPKILTSVAYRRRSRHLLAGRRGDPVEWVLRLGRGPAMTKALVDEVHQMRQRNGQQQVEDSRRHQR